MSIVRLPVGRGSALCEAAASMRIDDPTNPVFGTKNIGSRHATKVKIGRGAFAGKRGVVVRVVHPSSVIVRLDGIDLSFGPSELERIG